MTAYLKERTMDKDRNICGNCKYYSDTQGRCLRLNVPSTENSSCGHFAKKGEQIDWEQRRYEIAKEMMPVLYQDNELSEKGMAKEAILCANYLIQELKKVKDNDR